MSRVLNMGPGGLGGGNYRPIDSKREEFRKYLERAGVMDALTKVLVMLYEEPDKPDDALEFVRVNLGDKRPTMAEIEAMRADLESALQKIEALEVENAELRNQLGVEEPKLGGGGGSNASLPPLPPGDQAEAPPPAD